MTFQDSSKLESRNFISPFDDSDADLIIRSSDGGYFAVHGLILTKASAFFADMLSMPQGDVPHQSDTPVVELEEDTQTILGLLQLCYPLKTPAINSLEELSALMQACEKYSMDGVKDIIEHIYPHHLLESAPVQAYAMAVRTRSTIAKDAARLCLKRPFSYLLSSDIPELKSITAAAYHDLIKYHFSYSTAASSVVSGLQYQWLPNMRSRCWALCTNAACPTSSRYVVDAIGSAPVKEWFIRFVDEVAKSLMDQPEPISRLLVPSKLGVEIPTNGMCNSCQTLSRAQLDEFLKMLHEQIEIKVAGMFFEPTI